jgi:hypothetical protein
MSGLPEYGAMILSSGDKEWQNQKPTAELAGVVNRSGRTPLMCIRSNSCIPMHSWRAIGKWDFRADAFPTASEAQGNSQRS